MLFDYYVYLYLRLVFAGPAFIISKGDEAEKFTKHFSLTGIRPINLCQ